MNVWQIAAGDSGRNYTDLFLDYDLMLIGPGDPGPFDWNLYQGGGRKSAGAGIINQIRAFHDDVQKGDIVVLRFGHVVQALGVIGEEGYEWSSTFDDVFGWNLQHSRRVIWQTQLCKEIGKIQKSSPLFGSRRQMPTFTAVRDRTALDPIEHLFEKCTVRPLKPKPTGVPEPMSLEALGQALFARGLSNDAVDKVIAAIERQRRLIKWYNQDGKESERPTEHEVVAHMILPLLLALGWSEQLLAVEWRKIDLAAFDSTPTTSANCVLACEAKASGHGLQNVREQAFNYTKKLQLKQCRKVLLT